ncbi:MAG: sugar phosphate isomerase/epimerase [Chloroflexota bacterium]
MSIRVILSTGSLWLMDTAYTFDLAAEAGYDGIEIMCDDRYTTRDRRYLQKLSIDFGLPIPVLHTPFTGKLMGWGNASTELGKVRHTLELAEKMDVESIVVHLPLRYSRASVRLGKFSARAPWFSNMADFREWMARGGLKQLQGETPVQIAIENMPTKKMWGREVNPAYWNTVDGWSSVHDHLTLDTTHWATFGIDPIVPLRKAGDRVRHIHLSNYESGREHRLPQSGEIDLSAFLRELALMNFTGTVSVELQPDALAFDNPRATRRKLRETLDFCRQHLG